MSDVDPQNGAILAQVMGGGASNRHVLKSAMVYTVFRTALYCVRVTFEL